MLQVFIEYTLCRVYPGKSAHYHFSYNGTIKTPGTKAISIQIGRFGVESAGINEQV
jgi:hypothetical protein